MGGEQRETGRIPRTVECHLTSDLCDSCVPGDTVTVTGIVRVTNDGKNTLTEDKRLHYIYCLKPLSSVLRPLELIV